MCSAVGIPGPDRRTSEQSIQQLRYSMPHLSHIGKILQTANSTGDKQVSHTLPSEDDSEDAVEGKHCLPDSVHEDGKNAVKQLVDMQLNTHSNS